MAQPVDRPVRVDLPELGPSLGRVASPALHAGRSSGLWIEIRDVRLALAGTLFEAARSARQALDAGDPKDAASRLGRESWSAAWAQAVSAAGHHVVDHINRRLAEAAAEARIPRRRTGAVQVTDAEAHALTARLAGGAAQLVMALDELEVVSETTGTGALAVWRDAVLKVARRMEAAWIELETHVAEELERWDGEVERVRAWRRPRWPLWTITLAVLALATYLGLLLGGYLRVPAPLRTVVEWWWARW
jgi:thymidine phosphorylase